MYEQAVVHLPTSNWTFQPYLFMYLFEFWSRLKLPLATEWVSDVKETPVQTQFAMPSYTLHHWLHNIYVLSFLFFFLSVYMFIFSFTVTIFLPCYYLIFVVFSSNNLYLSWSYLQYSFLCCSNKPISSQGSLKSDLI